MEIGRDATDDWLFSRIMPGYGRGSRYLLVPLCRKVPHTNCLSEHRNLCGCIPRYLDWILARRLDRAAEEVKRGDVIPDEDMDDVFNG